MTLELKTDVAVVGAGPIGLETAVALKRAGRTYLHFEAGQIGQTISWFPPLMRFYSSIDRIALAGLPIHLPEGSKCTKEEYLAYLRAVVDQFELDVRTYTRVERIERTAEGFRLSLRSAIGQEDGVCRAERVIVACGDTHRPRKLGVPGEDLPHVSHYFHGAHPYFRRRVLVVGGRNSAVEAALQCRYAGARVALCCRRKEFDPRHVKYWMLPELEGRAGRGEIELHRACELTAIEPGRATLRPAGGGETFEIEADFVLLMTGYLADMSLLRGAGVRLSAPGLVPDFDETTMETNVSGLYLAGTVTAGTQQDYHAFIETSHVHVERILAALEGAPPPSAPPPRDMPES